MQKYDFNYSYLISHFSRLPQEVAKKIIYHLSRKVSYAYNIIDPVINGFSLNEIRSHFHRCDNSIITFVTRRLCLGFSSTSRVDSLYSFRRSVI